jgi:hypothetical protein
MQTPMVKYYFNYNLDLMESETLNLSQINEDQLNEFTYTLIKNFEANRMDVGVIEAVRIYILNLEDF